MEANRKKSCRAFSSNANSILILLGTGLHSVPVGALGSGRHELPYEPWFRGLKDNRQGARMKKLRWWEGEAPILSGTRGQTA